MNLAKKNTGEVVTSATGQSRLPQRAFTLIELVGTLAVLAILAATLLPVLVSRTDKAVADQEKATLQTFATALQNNILRNRYIPGSNDWAANLAIEVGANVASVSTNAVLLPRYYLIDPALQIGTNAAGTLPYAQSNLFKAIAATGQMAPPASPRLMIVSSTATRLPATIISGSGTPSSTVFSNLWNWSGNSATPPAGWPANWNNRGYDLQVQRINLAPLFVHLMLNNYPFNASVLGQYAIDQLATNQAFSNPANTNDVDAYFLQNTLLGLVQDSASGGALQSNQLLNRDATYYYVQGVWRARIMFSLPNSATNWMAMAMGALFQSTTSVFMQSITNSQAQAGATPTLVVSAMTNFMSAYVSWSNAGFPMSGTLYNNASTTQDTMATLLGNLANGL